MAYPSARSFLGLVGVAGLRRLAVAADLDAVRGRLVGRLFQRILDFGQVNGQLIDDASGLNDDQPDGVGLGETFSQFEVNAEAAVPAQPASPTIWPTFLFNAVTTSSI